MNKEISYMKFNIFSQKISPTEPSMRGEVIVTEISDNTVE